MWNICSFGRGGRKPLKSYNHLNTNASKDCKTQNVIYCLNVKLCQLDGSDFKIIFFLHNVEGKCYK